MERTCQLRHSNIIVWGEAATHKLESSTIVGIQKRGKAKVIPCVQPAAQRLYRLSTLQCNLPLTVRALHARDVLIKKADQMLVRSFNNIMHCRRFPYFSCLRLRRQHTRAIAEGEVRELPFKKLGKALLRCCF